jgi:hypothetical protein
MVEFFYIPILSNGIVSADLCLFHSFISCGMFELHSSEVLLCHIPFLLEDK